MSLRFRRILYTAFIIAFLIIVPLVCLYATGYKITSGFTIQKTGIFIVGTKPKGAKIYLNDKAQQLFFKKYFTRDKSHITTPAKIKNLLPGEYNIKIELEGYWPWEKKLTIKPGETTFAEDINLFKTNLPLMVKSGIFDHSSLSPNKKNLLLISEREITVINTEKNQKKSYAISTTTSPSPRQASTTNIAWSPKGHKVIINRLLFNLNDPENFTHLDNLLKTPAESYGWGTDSDNKIYFQTNRSLHSYDLVWNKPKTLVNDQIFDNYLAKNNYLYLINRSGQSVNLDIRSDQGGAPIGSIGLPASSYAFLHPGHKYLNLYNQKHQILYLIDPFSPVRPLRETISNINISRWIDETLLLYSNDFEIWLYDMANWQKTLLTRISSRITNIVWHPSNNYIIYTTSNSINILELDNREKYNITKLIELDSIKWPCLNAKGDTIYFMAKSAARKGCIN